MLAIFGRTISATCLNSEKTLGMLLDCRSENSLEERLTQDIKAAGLITSTSCEFYFSEHPGNQRNFGASVFYRNPICRLYTPENQPEDPAIIEFLEQNVPSQVYTNEDQAVTGGIAGFTLVISCWCFAEFFSRQKNPRRHMEPAAEPEAAELEQQAILEQGSSQAPATTVATFAATAG